MLYYMYIYIYTIYYIYIYIIQGAWVVCRLGLSARRNIWFEHMELASLVSCRKREWAQWASAIQNYSCTYTSPSNRQLFCFCSWELLRFLHFLIFSPYSDVGTLQRPASQANRKCRKCAKLIQRTTNCRKIFAIMQNHSCTYISASNSQLFYSFAWLFCVFVSVCICLPTQTLAHCSFPPARPTESAEPY